MKLRINKTIVFISLIVAIPLLVITLWMPHPFNHKSEFRSVVWVESRSVYALTAPGIDTVFFQSVNNDSTFNNITVKSAEAETARSSQGFWYSPIVPWLSSRGHILTLNNIASADTLTPMLNRNIQSWLARQEEEINRIEIENLQFYKLMRKYMATHDVTDEGYNQIALINQKHESRQDQKLRMVSTFRTLCEAPQVKITCEISYSYRYVTADGLLSPESKPCTMAKKYQGTPVLKLQTADKKKPAGTVSLGYPFLNFMRLTGEKLRRDVKMYSFNFATHPDSLIKQKLTTTQGKAWRVSGQKAYATTLPILPLSEGAPVVDKRGVLIGIATSDVIIPIP